MTEPRFRTSWGSWLPRLSGNTVSYLVMLRNAAALAAGGPVIGSGLGSGCFHSGQAAAKRIHPRDDGMPLRARLFPPLRSADGACRALWIAKGSAASGSDCKRPLIARPGARWQVDFCSGSRRHGGGRSAMPVAVPWFGAVRL